MIRSIHCRSANADDRMAAALAHPADDFLVGQHGAQRRTPVDRGLELIGQAMLVAVSLDGLVAFLGHFLGDRQLGDRPAALLATRRTRCRTAPER